MIVLKKLKNEYLECNITQTIANNRKHTEIEMSYVGKSFSLVPEKNAWYLLNTFTSTPFPAFLTEVSINVKDELSPGKYLLDIKSNLENLHNKSAFIEENEKGIQVFVQFNDTRLYSPIGYIVYNAD